VTIGPRTRTHRGASRFPLLLSAVAGSHGPTAAARGGMVSLRADRRATNRHSAPESRWPRQANSLNPKPRRASPRTLRSHGAEEEKDQSSTANPVYSFPGRRDHHLGPYLPRGGPGWPPGPLSHSSRRIFDHARVLFGTGLGRPRRCLPPRSRSAHGADANNGVRVPRGGRERALRGNSRGLGTCPEPQYPSSRQHSPTSYEDHRI
jgi:hypothetical protein